MNKNSPFLFLLYWASILLFLNNYQWFYLWLIMEMSTMTFFSLFYYEKYKSENLMTYFLIQSLASFFILISLTNNENALLENHTLDSLMLLGILVKLGMVPFHNWVLPVGYGLKKWLLPLFLLSQKIIPFVWVVSSTKFPIFWCAFVALLNLIWISVQNMISKSLKILIILSSMSHSSWLLMSSFAFYLWEIYFTIYISMTVFIIMYANSSLQKIFQKNNRTPLFMFMFLLGGLPPFLGFYPKFMIILTFSEMKNILLTGMILIFSLFDMFIYTRLGVLSTMKKKIYAKWNKGNQIMKIIFLSNVIMLPIIWL